MYPTMCCDYLVTLVPQLSKLVYKLLAAVISFILVFVLNLFGIDVVGWSQYVFAAFILTPIVI